MNYIKIELLLLDPVEDKVEIIKFFINILLIYQKISNILKKLQEEEAVHMLTIVL